MVSLILRSEKEQDYWYNYFINEKYTYLNALGLARFEIIEKYKKDYNEYSYNEKDYFNLLIGLERAIQFISNK